MILKLKEREKAIKLRKRGLSYSEILKQVPVAKSTLSLWLRNVGLTKKQRQRLTEKKILSQQKGARAKREQRIRLTKEIKRKAIKEVGEIDKKALWLIGTMLYWAEGAKQKENNPSQKVKFSNSDPLMIKVFLKWLQEICKIPLKDLNFEIYIHNTADIEGAKKYWPDILNIPKEKFQKIRLKKHKIKTIRRNIEENYHGLLNVTVKRSTNLNRKISGWIEGITQKII